MFLNLAVSSIGFSVDNIDNREKLIECIISNTFRLSGKSDKNSEKIALQSALKYTDEKSVIAVTDKEISKEFQDKFNISEQIIEKSFTAMLEKAKDIVNSGKCDKVMLVCHSEDGCAVIVVSENKANKPSQAVLSEIREKNSDSSISLMEEFVKVITAIIETELALNLNDNSEKYLWICSEKRQKAVDLNNSEVIVSQSDKCCELKYNTERYLIPVYFNSEDDIKSKLQKLKSEIMNDNIYNMSLKYVSELKNRNDNCNTAVFLIKDFNQLDSQINELLGMADKLMTKDFKWTNKTGSFYINRNAEKPKIVFMNPPGGMFKKNIFYKFYSKLGGMQSSNGNQYYHLLQSDNEMLNRYLFDIAVTYITMELLQSIGIEADYLSGASMGELAFITSDKIIKTRKEGNLEDNLKYTMKSITDTLCTVLNNQEKSAKKYFNREVQNWNKWYLKCSYNKVSDLVDNYDNVFIIITGSPADIIICGENESCTEIIQKLGCIALPLNDPFYIHTPILKDQSELIVNNVIDKKIYMDTENQHFEVFSTYFKKPVDDTCEMLANDIASIIVEKVDYASAVDELYNNYDARIFIDLSTGQLSGTWAKECLKNKSGFEVASIFEDSSSCDYLLDLCAKLMSFNVSFDYEKLISKFIFNKFIEKPVQKIETVKSKPIKQVEKVEKPVEIKKIHDIPEKKTETVTDKIDFSEDMKKCIMKQLENNNKAYKLYLEAQNQLYMQTLNGLNNSSDVISEKTVPVEKGYLWDREQVITMTDSSMSAVLGDKYKQVDEYPIRARMPLPPFLFVSRIVSIDAEFGKLRPSQIVAEYDFDEDCVFRNGESLISSLISSEASHIGIFLMGYMGLDVMSNGTLSFRALDASQTYYSDRPFRVGDTLRTVFTIHRFVQNGSTTILFYTYDSYNGDELIATSDASGGFFTKTELMSNKGVISNSKKKITAPAREFMHFTESGIKSYNEKQLADFYNGNYSSCFDMDTEISLKEKYFIPNNTNMIDRVTDIDYNGGIYKSGLICGEKNITPDMWPFKVHFKNDPVFPGIVMIEGAVQLNMFLLAHSGLLGHYKNTAVTMLMDNCVKSHFRGQVRKENSILKYEMHIKTVSEDENGIYIKSDVGIFNKGIQVIKIEDFGVKIFDAGSDN